MFWKKSGKKIASTDAVQDILAPEEKIIDEAEMKKSKEEAYSKLKLYDENAICSKCGYKEITTTSKFAFSFGNYWSSDPVQKDLYFASRYTVMERTCPRCSHNWVEKPLDYAPGG